MCTIGIRRYGPSVRAVTPSDRLLVPSFKSVPRPGAACLQSAVRSRGPSQGRRPPSVASKTAGSWLVGSLDVAKKLESASEDSRAESRRRAQAVVIKSIAGNATRLAELDGIPKLAIRNINGNCHSPESALLIHKTLETSVFRSAGGGFRWGTGCVVCAPSRLCKWQSPRGRCNRDPSWLRYGGDCVLRVAG